MVAVRTVRSVKSEESEGRLGGEEGKLKRTSLFEVAHSHTLVLLESRVVPRRYAYL